MMYGWGGYGGIGMGIGMIVFWVIALAILGFGGYGYFHWAGRGCSRQGVLPYQTDSALNILKERYARGEITEEEFTKIKEGLKA